MFQTDIFSFNRTLDTRYKLCTSQGRTLEYFLNLLFWLPNIADDKNTYLVVSSQSNRIINKSLRLTEFSLAIFKAWENWNYSQSITKDDAARFFPLHVSYCNGEDTRSTIIYFLIPRNALTQAAFFFRSIKSGNFLGRIWFSKKRSAKENLAKSWAPKHTSKTLHPRVGLNN